VGDPAVVVDPDRHACRGQRFHAAVALAGGGLVGDQTNIDAPRPSLRRNRLRELRRTIRLARRC
jgi:hypothetical protein